MNLKEEQPKKVRSISTIRKKLSIIGAITVIGAAGLAISYDEIKELTQLYRDNIVIDLTYINIYGERKARELEKAIELYYPNFLGEREEYSIRGTTLDFEGRKVVIPENSNDEIKLLKEELEEYIEAIYSNKYEDADIKTHDIYLKQENRIRRKINQ